MPLARNFTRRFGFGRNAAAEPMPQNARKEISLPLNLMTSEGFFDDVVGGHGSLISAADTKTTDLRTSTDSSTDDKSNRPDSSAGSPTTAPSLTDASSIENSPTNDNGFLNPTLPDLEPVEPRGLFAAQDAPPAIPKRVPSHSKKEHVRLARKRSLRSSDTTVKADSPSPTKPAYANRPAFAAGPAYSAGPIVDEGPLLEVDEDPRFDAAYLREHGLHRFSAAAYQSELAMSPFADDGTPSWI